MEPSQFLLQPLSTYHHIEDITPVRLLNHFISISWLLIPLPVAPTTEIQYVLCISTSGDFATVDVDLVLYQVYSASVKSSGELLVTTSVVVNVILPAAPAPPIVYLPPPPPPAPGAVPCSCIWCRTSPPVPPVPPLGALPPFVPVLPLQARLALPFVFTSPPEAVPPDVAAW